MMTDAELREGSGFWGRVLFNVWATVMILSVPATVIGFVLYFVKYG